MTLMHNERGMLSRRRELRNHSTKDEIVLWLFLKKKAFDGIKFRRQHSLGPYILDFYAPSVRLAVELDGKIHETPGAIKYDAERDAYLRSIGVKVLRITGDEFSRGVDHVLNLIRRAL